MPNVNLARVGQIRKVALTTSEQLIKFLGQAGDAFQIYCPDSDITIDPESAQSDAMTLPAGSSLVWKMDDGSVEHYIKAASGTPTLYVLTVETGDK